MDKLCINCDTENPADAVFCSDCGMSLTRAPTGEEALKLKEEIDRKAESPMREEAKAPKAERRRRIARILAVIWAGYWTLWLAPLVIEMLEYELVSLANCLTIAIYVVPSWVIAAIAWRREGVGGPVLLAANFFLPCCVLASPPTFHWDSLLNYSFFVFLWSLSLLPMLALGCIAGFLFLASERRSAREELPDRAPIHQRFADFSPMPEEFGEFARMLEEAKAESGALICFECGHYNPIGQTQCEECGASVLQTALARWVYGYGKDK